MTEISSSSTNYEIHKSTSGQDGSTVSEEKNTLTEIQSSAFDAQETKNIEEAQTVFNAKATVAQDAPRKASEVTIPIGNSNKTEDEKKSKVIDLKRLQICQINNENNGLSLEEKAQIAIELAYIDKIYESELKKYKDEKNKKNILYQNVGKLIKQRTKIILHLYKVWECQYVYIQE